MLLFRYWINSKQKSLAMEIRDKIFVAVFAATLYFCLYAVYNSARGGDPYWMFLIFASSAPPLFVVFILCRLLMRSATTAALVASAGVFLLHRQALLGNAEAVRLDFQFGEEMIFAAGRLTGAGAQRLMTEYALQSLMLLAAAALAGWTIGRVSARTA